jgi:3-hydroxyacyl-[acyl-carrier-protein] dehydratase
MSQSEIHSAIPHRAPFLFVDEIVSRGDSTIVCRKTFPPEEYFFAGHYPDYPLVPGVILCEAAMQAGAILVSQFIDDASEQIPVVARMTDVRFKRMVRPGEMIEMSVTLRERAANALYLDATVTCAGKLAVRFEFTCMLTRRQA